MIDIANLRNLLAEASPGPWEYRWEDDSLGGVTGALIADFGGGGDPCDCDAQLIVAAVNALPELLDEVERLRIEVGELEDSRAMERDESAEVVKVQRERIAQLEAALGKVRPLIGCDMGEECAEYGHWEDCAIKVAGAIIDAALEGKEQGK